MAFCIPKHLVTRLKGSLFNGEINLKQLHNMSSAERNQYFSKLTDGEMGTFLNTEFEKAIVKNNLVSWVESAFSPKEKKESVYKSIVDKINNLDDQGLLNPVNEKAFLSDFVADRLGIRVSPEEVKIISEKAQKIKTAQEKVGADIGLPSKGKETMDFYEAKKEMDDFLQEMSPASKTKILTGTIGRGSMLFSVKSPILNIISNMEVGFTEALSRRLASGQFKGANNKLALDYMKLANQVYQKTGYDISRMLKLSDAGTSGQRILGETVHAKGKGTIRKVGQFFEDKVFKQLMGAPDVAFSSAHFADSVNLNSMKLAKGNKKLASEYMEDSMRLDPKTEQGSLLKYQGVLDAQVATWTDSSRASRLSEGIRKVLNDFSGDFRAGDYLMPFVKTPANVISTGMDYAGLGAFKALGKTVWAMKNKENVTPQLVQGIIRDLVRSGLGLTGAAIISAMLDPDDFLGAYDPSMNQSERLRNANWNSIRINGKWMSTDFLGPLMAPVTGMMYAKKYGKTNTEQAFQYGKGLVQVASELPGISDASDFFKSLESQQNKSLEEMTGETRDYILNQSSSRLIPSISSDVAKALDPYERNTKDHKIMARIPFVRQMLPVKKDIFGKKIKGESATSDILFGSRVKTDKDNKMLKKMREISSRVDKPINFTDWDRSSSKRLTDFKNQVGEKIFNMAKAEYGQRLKDNLEYYLETSHLDSDEDAWNIITGIDSKVMNSVLDDYSYLPEKKDRAEPFDIMY